MLTGSSDREVMVMKMKGLVTLSAMRMISSSPDRPYLNSLLLDMGCEPVLLLELLLFM